MLSIYHSTILPTILADSRLHEWKFGFTMTVRYHHPWWPVLYLCGQKVFVFVLYCICAGAKSGLNTGDKSSPRPLSRRGAVLLKGNLPGFIATSVWLVTGTFGQMFTNKFSCIARSVKLFARSVKLYKELFANFPHPALSGPGHNKQVLLWNILTNTKYFHMGGEKTMKLRFNWIGPSGS